MNRKLKARIERLLSSRETELKAAQALLDASEADGEDLTEEETQAHTGHLAKVRSIDSQIKALEDQAELEASEPALPIEESSPTAPRSRIESNGVHNSVVALLEEGAEFLEDSYGEASAQGEDGHLEINSQGNMVVDFADSEKIRATATYAKAFFARSVGETPQFRSVEQRDAVMAVLQSDNPGRAGFLNAPYQFAEGVLKDLNQSNIIRARARKFRTNADKLGVRKQVARPDGFAWSPEIHNTANNQDTALEVGLRELEPHYWTREIEISNDLIRRAVIDPMDWAREEINIETAEQHEDAFLNGDGVQKPLGILTPSASGITTARDESFAVTAGVFDNFDDFIDAEMSVYRYLGRPGTALYTSKLAHSAARKVKDGNSNYIWYGHDVQPGVSAGRTLSGLGVQIVEGIADSMASSAYFGFIGDLNYYWIVDHLEMEVRVLDQLEARRNKTVMIFRGKTDGMPMLEEAFARLKVA